MAVGARASIRLKLSSDKHVTTVLDALTLEAKTPASRRARVDLQREGLFLLLTVEAEDTVALRSTLNAYLRWISSTLSVLDAVKS